MNRIYDETLCIKIIGLPAAKDSYGILEGGHFTVGTCGKFGLFLIEFCKIAKL